MGCIITVIGAIVPRVLVLVGWNNDPTGWASAFGSPVWPVLGFLFLPWTTFTWALFQSGGFEGLELLWLGLAVVADLGTWGGSVFGNRERVSNFRY